MFDGVIITLIKVRHVPDLRKSLISLGTLDVNGFTFSGANGILKKEERSKLDTKSKKCIFRGYKADMKKYKTKDNPRAANGREEGGIGPLTLLCIASTLPLAVADG
ncbi:hypothetical protein EJ110_NYTH44563 [Nymphaea thermarum]|nr:hypothetical protein EJ110_NYTH44563 [Nymphaea thermarum]